MINSAPLSSSVSECERSESFTHQKCMYILYIACIRRGLILSTLM